MNCLGLVFYPQVSGLFLYCIQRNTSNNLKKDYYLVYFSIYLSLITRLTYRCWAVVRALLSNFLNEKYQ